MHLSELRTAAFWLDRARMAAIVAVSALVFLAIAQSAALTPHGATVFRSVVWFLASLTATLACAKTARACSGEERKAWLFMMSACGLWCGAQLYWGAYIVAHHAMPRTPHWVQLFFFASPLLLMVGVLQFPKQAALAGFTVRHSGNLALLACAIVVSFVVTLREPMLLPGRPWLANVAALATSSAHALTCMAALYLLWSYRWRQSYWPLLMIATGAGLQAITYITNIHLRMTGSFASDRWYNLSWLVGFGAIACAAHEYIWQMKHPSVPSEDSMLSRERWLEAIIPAALIVLMLVTVWLNAAWISRPVATVATLFAIVFALILSVRDAWIQREEQRLVAALNASNDDLLVANRKLATSEHRYRALNADLEKRVTERTGELQSAYRELESFSYAVAHDIKAPLRAVNSFAALLLEEHGQQLNQDARGYAERMRHGALHMAQLVDDLLAYARVERLELQLEPMSLAVIIENCLAEQRDEIVKLNAVVSVQVDAGTLHIDRSALMQTLRNLVQNALKFSSAATPPRIAIRTERSADRVRIVVSDNGIGFDMQYHDRIFALFQRLHRADEYPGTGIGLAIARKAIERMGGRMWAQSAIGEGATFFIELPLSQAKDSMAA